MGHREQETVACHYISHKKQPQVELFVPIGSTAIAPESKVTVDRRGSSLDLPKKRPESSNPLGALVCSVHLTIYGRPNAYSELPAAIAMYSFLSTANAIGEAYTAPPI